MTNLLNESESKPTFHPDPEDVLECARSIRPELEELLGPKAEQVDLSLNFKTLVN
jgi:hypothetical protein